MDAKLSRRRPPCRAVRPAAARRTAAVPPLPLCPPTPHRAAADDAVRRATPFAAPSAAPFAPPQPVARSAVPRASCPPCPRPRPLATDASSTSSTPT